MNQQDIKDTLRAVCVAFANAKLNTIQDTVRSNQEALDSESKSSAGDKHETGRAMLQLEMEKAGQQLKEVQQMKLIVEKINVVNVVEVGCLGAIIETGKANYFLGVSVGKVVVDAKDYFVVSPSSPIGKLLLGKVKNDSFLFQGLETKVLDVF